jgi:enterochelin esterase-like enzyme
MVTSLKQLALVLAGSMLLSCGDKTENPVSPKDSAVHTVRITVTVPDDAPTVYLAGNLPELGPWHPKRFQLTGTGTKRHAILTVPHGHTLRYKVTAGSWEREGLGPSGALLPEFTATIDSDKALTAEIAGFRVDPDLLIADWQGSGVEGELVYWKDVSSEFLKEKRHIVTWLPPGYDANSDKKYKVIYMQDGQNIFDPRISYTNIDWGVDEAMMRAVRAGSFEPAIIVGIWNTPERLQEYSPWDQAPQYARFMLEELMPRIETEFNVLTGPENTFVMGSSMGGLISFYLVKEHPDLFGACGCVSSHFSWSAQAVEWLLGHDPTAADPTPFIERDIADGETMPNGVRLYFDYGTEGLDSAYEAPHSTVKQWLLQQGFTEGIDLKMKKFEGADHSETSWRARVGEQLDWLLGAKAN